MGRLSATLVVALLAAFAEPAFADAACFDLYRLSDHERAVEPGIVVAATQDVPQHCVVRGVINRAIRFEVRMPTTGWTGRFLMEGTGGSSGYIADTTRDLHRGFAIASTDTGHVGTDVDFAYQPEAALDYAFRAVHLATLTAKDVVQAFYARDITYAYYQGCSNGGRQGLIEATRFPDDYDGIVAGAPAFQVMAEFLPWSVTVHRAQQAHPLTEAHLELLDNASREACDALDGLEDGVINDPRECTLEHYDPTSLLCRHRQKERLGQNERCLTEGQLENVMTHLRGVVDAEGNVISPGYMPGAENAGDWRMWALPGAVVPTTGEKMPGTLNGTVTDMLKVWVYDDPDYDTTQFDVLNDRADLARASAILDVNTAELGEFKEHGGKILMYQGWNDYPLRPQRAIDYLEQVAAANGGARKARDFFRLFMVPGMVHCANGPGAWETDYLDPLVDWVENGKAPERIIGTRPDDAFARPQCVYPKLARYAQGDENSAESFTCK